MNNIPIDKDLKDLKNSYLEYFKEIDNKSLYYLIQMIELMYNEISYEVYDKGKLYDLVCNNYKNNTSLVFTNMRDYYLKVTNNLVNDFCKVIKVSATNKYITSVNLTNIYNNFKKSIDNNVNLDTKIKALSNANSNFLLEQIHTTCVVNNRVKAESALRKYSDLITEEMIKNVNNKKELILNTYKEYISEMSEDAISDQEKINEMNLKVVTNTTYLYLKEEEYFVIEKYANNNVKTINEYFDKIDKTAKEYGGKKSKNNKTNLIKDYFLGFNNTIRVKTMNIFEEMNSVITYDKGTIDAKMKEFSDLISKIYQINLTFDKQFDEYKKDYSIPIKNNQKFTNYYEKESKYLTEQIKLNITNIFRENTKTYNDVMYRSIILKSRLNEFTEVLSEKKVKDLLKR